MKIELKTDISRTSSVAITHDSWTSIATDSFETVTVHYIVEEAITGNWQLKAKVLETKKIPGMHTADAIGKYMEEMKERWALPKIVAVSDNATVEKRKTFSTTCILQWDIS